MGASGAVMMMAAVQGLGPESLRPVNLRDFQAACKAQKKSVEVRGITEGLGSRN